MTLPLFVYGTLRDADVRRMVLGHDLAAGRLQPATAPGFAAVAYPGRLYPALCRTSGGVAEGLLIEPTADELAALDAFEGAEYRRARIDAMVDGQSRAAEAYWPVVPARNCPAWRLEEWQARHKAGFLASEGAVTARRAIR